MSPDEVTAAFGVSAAGWAERGVTVTRDGDNARVRHGDTLLDRTETARGGRVYKPVLFVREDGTDRAPPYPPGFVPSDPIRAREIERARWLPKDPDDPARLLAVRHR
jgi:hypothetical protein